MHVQPVYCTCCILTFYLIYFDSKYLAISIYIFKLIPSLTNVITIVMSNYGANEISKCFI